MTGPSLQSGIDKAGGPVQLLWKPNAQPPAVPVLQPEYAGWSQEQAAWRDSVAFFDLSHHMMDLFIEGPDATRLLTAVSANNYENFPVGRAKQFVPVTEEGHLVTDGLLFRLKEDLYDLVCIGAAQNWVMFHAEKGGYDVKFRLDPTSDYRKGPPDFFRYQVQGPDAPAVIEKILGGAPPSLKFLHFAPVTIAGRAVNAFRHGMAGQPGLEFFGPWADGEAVMQVILEAGAAYGMVNVGGLAYYSTGIESGWIPTPLPGIYSSPQLAQYRNWVGLYSYEGMSALQGSYYSENPEDYYCSPYELGYDRSIAFNHDFIGRKALEAARGTAHRKKVTLVWDRQDIDQVFGRERGFVVSYSKDRVERDGKLVGMSLYAGSIGPADTILSLALVDEESATPGTEVAVVWGQHPGPGAPPDVPDGFERIRAVVQPAPITEHARTAYRKA